MWRIPALQPPTQPRATDPFSPAARSTLSDSRKLAVRQACLVTGTEHLLLGLVQSGASTAGRWLCEAASLPAEQLSAEGMAVVASTGMLRRGDVGGGGAGEYGTPPPKRDGDELAAAAAMPVASATALAAAAASPLWLPPAATGVMPTSLHQSARHVETTTAAAPNRLWPVSRRTRSVPQPCPQVFHHHGGVHPSSATVVSRTAPAAKPSHHRRHHRLQHHQ